MVGGTGLQTLPYTGTGLYETQKIVGLPVVQVKGITQPQFIESRQIEMQKNFTIIYFKI